VTRRFFAAAPANSAVPGQNTQLVLTMAARAPAPAPTPAIAPGVAWVYARGRDLADPFDPFPQTLEHKGGQNIGMVFPYAPGDTVLWEVDVVPADEGQIFDVILQADSPLIIVEVIGGNPGQLRAGATLNGLPAGTLTLTSTGF